MSLTFICCSTSVELNQVPTFRSKTDEKAIWGCVRCYSVPLHALLWKSSHCLQSVIGFGAHFTKQANELPPSSGNETNGCILVWIFPCGFSSGLHVSVFACNYRPEAAAGAGSAFAAPLWTFACSPALICSQSDGSSFPVSRSKD